MTADCRAVPGPAPTVVVRGDLDRSSDQPLLAAYAAAVDGGTATTVLLDLAAMDYLDSSGLAVVVGLLSRARAEGHRLRVRGLSPHVRELFALTRLNEHLDVEEDG